MKRFIIYTNPHKDKELGIAKRIALYLIERGQRCLIRVRWKDRAENFLPEEAREEGIPSTELSFVSLKPLTAEGEMNLQQENGGFPYSADCMIVLGGDGTMLQAAGDALYSKTTLVGVNLGSLGYMTEIELSSLEQSLERLIEGDYTVERRMMLQGQVLSGEGCAAQDWALNDIVISRRGSLQILKFDLSVNGQFLHDYLADGLIVTTPTGSTGYNLSAGGPIVEPKASLMMLTPICPHTLNQRSIVLSPEDEVVIEISPGRDGQDQEVEAVFDGGRAVILHTGDRVRIVKAKKTADFIRLDQVSFLEVLHRKLRENR